MAGKRFLWLFASRRAKPGSGGVCELGGNVNGWSRSRVNQWRNGCVAERERIGLAGFGEFHFVFENSRTFVMVDAARAVARGMSLL